MKKFLSLALIFTSPTLAYIAGKSPISENRFYCPEKVVCTEKNNSGSCEYTTPSPQYWRPVTDKHDIGTYEFMGVRSGFHTTYEGLIPTECSYVMSGGIPGRSSIKVESSFYPVLEAYYDKSTKWQVNGDNNQNEISCYGYEAHDTQPCPLKEASGFGFYFLNKTKYNYAPRLVANNNFKVNLTPGFYRFIKYEEVTGCWDARECKFDVELNNIESEHNVIGSIVVNMDNKMKIVKTTISDPSTASLRIIKPFNIVEVTKISENESPSLDIINSIRPSISVSVNKVPLASANSRTQVHLSFSTVETVCSGMQECKIELSLEKTGHSALIGSFIIDMLKNKSITSTFSTRSSEIIVNKIDDHSLEVRYPSMR